MIRTRHAIAALLSVLIAPVAFAFPLTWTLREFQPNIPQGGRANTIAVNPATRAS